MSFTLTIIKPDAVRAGNTGNIIAHLQTEGFTIRAMKQMRLTDAQAKGFLRSPRGASFFTVNWWNS